MDPAAIILLGGAAAANSVVPGPCILVAASRAAIGGLARGLRVTFGIALSDVLLLGTAWAMILGLMTLSAAAEHSLRWAGLCLLALMGIAMLRARPTRAAAAPTQGRLHLGDVTLGLALGLTSPLNLLFMLALLPQFIDLGRIDLACIAAATAAVLIGGALPLVGACLCAARLVTTGLRHTRVVTRLCGVALLGFAGIAAAGLP